MTTNNPKYPKGKRGFASMSEEKRRAISQLGGRAAHRRGVAHQWTSAEARVAGRKGGQANKRPPSPEEQQT